MLPTYELYALKYGHHQRLRSTNFLGGDPHDGPMPMDYFVWLARSADRTIVIDTGFSPAGFVFCGPVRQAFAQTRQACFASKYPTAPTSAVNVSAMPVTRNR